MFEPSFQNNYNDTYTVTARCVFGCGNITQATVAGPAVFRWRQGAFAQDAFADLTADDREALFISGVCSTCYGGLVDEAIDEAVTDDDDVEEYDDTSFDDLMAMAEAFGEAPPSYDSDPMGYNSDSYINYLNER